MIIVALGRAFIYVYLQIYSPRRTHFTRRDADLLILRIVTHLSDMLGQRHNFEIKFLIVHLRTRYLNPQWLHLAFSYLIEL